MNEFNFISALLFYFVTLPEVEFPEGTFSLLLTRNQKMIVSVEPPQMIVSPIGDVTITNDGATILKEIDTESKKC